MGDWCGNTRREQGGCPSAPSDKLPWLSSHKAWSGEQIPPRTMQRILTTRKALLAKCTPHEEAFQKMVNKLLYHLPGKCKSILRYTREKAFVVTGSQWFFGDYWFKAVKLVVELDGGQHQTELARAYDEWRTQLLSAHGIVVIRFRNTEIEAWPWQELERRFLDAVFTVHHHSNIKGTLRKGLRRLPPRRGE